MSWLVEWELSRCTAGRNLLARLLNTSGGTKPIISHSVLFFQTAYSCIYISFNNYICSLHLTLLLQTGDSLCDGSTRNKRTDRELGIYNRQTDNILHYTDTLSERVFDWASCSCENLELVWYTQNHHDMDQFCFSIWNWDVGFPQ